MTHIRVIVCRVDDPTSDQMTELPAFDFPASDVSTLTEQHRQSFSPSTGPQ